MTTTQQIGNIIREKEAVKGVKRKFWSKKKKQTNKPLK